MIGSSILSRLNEEQHGFVKRQLTVTNLVLYSFLLGGIEGGGQVDSIYTDFSKAFDRVDHHLLVLNLERYGFHGFLLLQ